MAFNPDKCLKFKALADNCTISLGSHKFSKNGTSWQDFSITLKAGETCFVKGTSFTSTQEHYDGFSISAAAEIVSGNIMSLVDDGAGELDTVQDYGFRGLFRYCEALQSVPEGLLPASSVGVYAYEHMFEWCFGLTTLPKGLLPAMTLHPYCYENMFAGCKNLIELPSGLLPATVVPDFAYSFMFTMCNAVTVIPSGFFPSEITFSGVRACGSMFYHCKNLKEIHVPFAYWPGDTTITWVKELPASGDFYAPSTLPVIYDTSYIPPGWTKHNESPTPPIPPGPTPPGDYKSVSFVYFGNITVGGTL